MTHAPRGAHHPRAGAQGDHRRGRVPARAPAPRAAAHPHAGRGRAHAWSSRASASIPTCARAITPACGSTAARRSRCARTPIRCARIPIAHVDEYVRRLRRLRRGRPRRRALPVVLRGGGRSPTRSRWTRWLSRRVPRRPCIGAARRRRRVSDRPAIVSRPDPRRRRAGGRRALGVDRGRRARATGCASTAPRSPASPSAPAPRRTTSSSHAERATPTSPSFSLYPGARRARRAASPRSSSRSGA